jgi:hypothetical protein
MCYTRPFRVNIPIYALHLILQVPCELHKPLEARQDTHSSVEVPSTKPGIDSRGTIRELTYKRPELTKKKGAEETVVQK